MTADDVAHVPPERSLDMELDMGEETGPSASGGARLPLPAGLVLLGATGFVDIYTFLAHGHVFAEAMTGNLVLIGVGTFDPQIVEFWRPLAAFGAFVLGAALLWWLDRRFRLGRGSRSSKRTPQLMTLAFEVVVLSAAPADFPSVIVWTTISFASGLQIAAFRQIGLARFTTTVMTSNSLRTVDATLSALASRARQDRIVALRLLGALGSFVAGVFVGGAVTDRIGARAGWVAAALLVVAGAGYLAHHPGRSTQGVSAVSTPSPDPAEPNELAPGSQA